MIKFTKMHGIGNDFVMVDAVNSPPPEGLAELSQRMCDRRRGVGSDGLIVAERGTDAPFKMRMFNPDGSESEMCGNGIRCMAVLLADHGHASGGEIPIETAAGLLKVKLVGAGCVQVDMGPATLKRGEIEDRNGGRPWFRF
jgi:diaminopimelate epimerase